MAKGFGLLRTAAAVGAAGLLSAAVNGGRKKSYIEIFDLADTDMKLASGDTNLVAKIPQGEVITGITVQSSVSLGTNALSFGTIAAPASVAAALAYGTTPEAEKAYPVLAASKGVPLAADTLIYMTNSVAALPGAGKVVVEIETSARG